MEQTIDLTTLLAPIAGDNPAGEDLRYAPVYDDLKEARRADDLLDRGDWSRELKTADWDQVYVLATDILQNRSKDLMVAAWLMEALLNLRGFAGADFGLSLIHGLLRDFWDSLYPQIEDGDLEYRSGPLEFINEKLAVLVRSAPLTDPGTGLGYSWLQWKESVKVGKEADTLNQWGDVDEKKKMERDALIAEGKLTGESFATAVQLSSRAFYEALAAQLNRCLETFAQLDALVDEKFGSEAPRLSDFRTALEDCNLQAGKILKEKRLLEPDPEPKEPAKPMDEQPFSAPPEPEAMQQPLKEPAATPVITASLPQAAAGVRVNRLLGSGGLEEARWQQAQELLKKGGIEAAVEELLAAACSAQSPREQANYQLLIARLCLQVERADMARPLAEQLFARMEELQLARWESPIWIAEVLETLYRCLTDAEASDEDSYRAREILNRLCTTDITKAIKYRPTP